MTKNVEAIYPLSPLQEGMLFHTLAEPDSGVYFQQTCFRLRGEVKARALQAAWAKVVQRHAILRTLFLWDREKEPLQIVRDHVEIPWKLEDWRGVPSAEKDSRMEAFLQEDRKQGFDLSEAPLLRLALFHLDDDSAALIFSSHHILLDGWSSPILIKEVFSCYEAAVQERDLRLDAPKPYRDYISWLKKQDMKKAEAYWRKALKGFEMPIPLPNGRLAPAAGAAVSSGGAHGSRRIRLDAKVSASFQLLARTRQLTVNTLLQGIWALLLSRYANTTDVVFGSTVAGRPADLHGVETMVGLFINTLPVRIQVPAQESFLSWLKALQQQQAEARQFEYAHLAQVQTWSDIPRGQPLFDSLFIFENYPFDRSQANRYGGLEIEGIKVLESTNYPLTIEAVLEDGLEIAALYDRRRLNDGTIDRILGHFRVLTESVTANPEGKLCELPMLTAEEKRQLLEEFNDTSTVYEADVCAYQLFEGQAARRPREQAAVFEDSHLCYEELNSRANQLARRLRRMGVGPDVLVGIHMERGLEMLAAVLAVHKAGGAYVPLDPGFPKERLEFYARDSGLSVLLVQRHLASSGLAQKRRDGEAPEELDVESRANEIAEEDSANLDPAPGASSENLAYVIYTSGSTGKPKGVQISQRALVNLLLAMQREPGMSEKDTLLAPTTLSFDIAGLELFLPLISGARVVMVSQETAVDGIELLKRLESFKATVMQATPATWRLLLESGWRRAEGLKVLCGGEALPRELADRILETGAELWNMYGPTETTIWSAVHRVERGKEQPRIGRPIANTDFHVLDSGGQLAPLGVPGELYIGGDGLAQGYLNRPELTVERFIPHPFRQGQRLYKTGDLVRRLPDGTLEFLGRTDHQVKIRGFRIELGEIESRLLRYPGIREAVVILREEAPGNQRLIAYIVLEKGVVPEHGDLRSYLEKDIPEFMIPSAYVFLEAFPLTPNGKVDRRALPAPADQHLDHSWTYVAPRTRIEKTIASAWEEILGLKEVGIHDNFFSVGGHSLLAMRLLARLRQVLGMDLALRAIMDNPTVAGLAGRIRNNESDGTLKYESKPSSWKSLVPIQPLGTKVPFFLVAGAHADEEQFLRYLSNMIPHLGLDQPVYGFKPRGLDGKEKSHASVEEMARDYVEELLSFRPEGPYLIGGECVGGIVAFEMAQVLAKRGKDIGLLFLMDTPRPTTLGNILGMLEVMYNRILDMARHVRNFRSVNFIDFINLIRKKRRYFFPMGEAERIQKKIENTEMRYISTLSHYRPRPYPGKLTYLVSEGMSFRSIHWMGLAAQGMEVHTVPGDHVTRLTVYGKITAKRLTECLREAVYQRVSRT